ncbi:plasma membrane ATPase 1-like [Dorcoceras hygrometricum]|uniref:Plasma membrane ATPase 1-like n=1 Tax=Dorcoceras hygrometricum TaxID=472368 RepID=A0A2Z7ACN3_9LAMI|nr:plasma membrane ATPase 1-like [Dorcoceras hygrometricum]
MFLVDWAVKMRIRPPEFETSICDAKYHVSLSTRSVLGKCVYLVTLAMSLFDLQDVRIAIGSIATLDLPMVVDLIGIYGLKGPYLLAASLLSTHTPPPPARVVGIRSGRFDEENPFVQNSSVLLVHPDEGVSVLVVDRIGDYLPQSTEKSRVLVIPVGARHKCQQVQCSRVKSEEKPVMHLLTKEAKYNSVRKPFNVYYFVCNGQISTPGYKTEHKQLNEKKAEKSEVETVLSKPKIKGIPELEHHYLYQVEKDFKLVNQIGKAEEQFKRRIKQSSSAVNEA